MRDALRHLWRDAGQLLSRRGRVALLAALGSVGAAGESGGGVIKRIWNSPWLWLLMSGNLAYSVSQTAYWWNVAGLCACVFCFAVRAENKWGKNKEIHYHINVKSDASMSTKDVTDAIAQGVGRAMRDAGRWAS